MPVKHPSDAQIDVYNRVVGLSNEIVDELMAILRWRGRGVSLPASIEAGKMLLAIMGVRVGSGTEATGSPASTIINHTGSGPMQVVSKSATGPDRLTQELIDIVRAGNNGSGNGHKPNGQR